MLQEKMLKPLEFEFHGKAGEYFRIWIVNVLLTIVTLGIYSAWAKVRNKQYFYGNTLLDGSPFEYMASPIAILKGRLVVAAILIVYSLTVNFFPMLKVVFIVLFIVFLPWLIMRSLMFNARYSSYRNLNFAFDKNLGGAVKTFIGLGLLVPLTLGLIYPYYMYAIQSYRINHHSFGQLYFRLRSSVKEFYKYYLLAAAVFIVGIVVVVFLFKGTIVSMQSALQTDSEAGGSGVVPNIAVSILLMAVLYGVIYFFAYAYLRANIFNVVWSNTALNKASEHTMKTPTVPLVAFKGSLSPWTLFHIYLTNTIAIIASIGLLIPWAKVRLARYRIERLAISSIADLSAITAVERERVGTIGSEMGDILDIDIGL